jgi:hypothetical protein
VLWIVDGEVDVRDCLEEKGGEAVAGVAASRVELHLRTAVFGEVRTGSGRGRE